MKFSLIPESLRTLYTGKPFCSNPTAKTQEEFLAELRQRKPENCDILFEDGLLEIEITGNFLIGRGRIVFKGKLGETNSGLMALGKFELGNYLKIVCSSMLVLWLFLGLGTGYLILAFLILYGAVLVVSTVLWIIDSMNIEREKAVKRLLNGS